MMPSRKSFSVTSLVTCSLFIIVTLTFTACPSSNDGHNHTPGAVATCTTPQICTDCKDVIVAALGHDESTKTVNGLCARTGCTSPLLYTIGDTGPGEGKIFYIADDGFDVEGYTGTTGSFAGYTAHYLEVAPANASDPICWGLATLDDNTEIGNGLTTYANDVAADNAISNGIIGNGRKDTQIIIAEMGSSLEYAARSASEYTTDSGHTDWFLPSITEFNLLYQSTSTVSGMPTSGNFWSSSQLDKWQAWYQNFFFCNQQFTAKNSSTSITVRAVRAF
ncbi:MAG: DUF1566 domain-containing protein [Treponema sp.]|nr:DUF1566 domain-containing protein [Treponema sp.]